MKHAREQLEKRPNDKKATFKKMTSDEFDAWLVVGSAAMVAGQQSSVVISFGREHTRHIATSCGSIAVHAASIDHSSVDCRWQKMSQGLPVMPFTRFIRKKVKPNGTTADHTTHLYRCLVLLLAGPMRVRAQKQTGAARTLGRE